MSAHLKDYDYDLPRELIAQRPPEHRDDSRMMVLHRDTQAIEHRQFRELKTFLQQGDLLVLNDTQVLPARRFSNDGAIEFLFRTARPQAMEMSRQPRPKNAGRNDSRDR